MHKYISVKRSVCTVRSHKCVKVCVDCGVPLPRSSRGVGVRCLSCTQKYRWRLYRESHGLNG